MHRSGKRPGATLRQTKGEDMAASDRELPMSSSHPCAQGKDVWTLLTNDIDHGSSER